MKCACLFFAFQNPSVFIGIHRYSLIGTDPLLKKKKKHIPEKYSLNLQPTTYLSERALQRMWHCLKANASLYIHMFIIKRNRSIVDYRLPPRQWSVCVHKRYSRNIILFSEAALFLKRNSAVLYIMYLFVTGRLDTSTSKFKETVSRFVGEYCTSPKEDCICSLKKKQGQLS